MGSGVCRASVSDAGALRLASHRDALQVPNVRARSVDHPERNKDLALEAFDTQIPVYSLPSCERSLSSFGMTRRKTRCSFVQDYARATNERFHF
jgi:hypothetical protein